MCFAQISTIEPASNTSSPTVDAVWMRDRFGRHVQRRADDGAARRRCAGIAPEIFHQPEVDHLHDVGLIRPLGEDDVGGLDVAVNEAERVGFGQRAVDLRENVDGARGLDRAMSLDEVMEIEPFEVLHRVVEEVTPRAARS